MFSSNITLAVTYHQSFDFNTPFYFFFSCAAHTLDLVIKKDFKDITNASYLSSFKKILETSLQKCNQIWTGESHSMRSEKIVSIIGRKLPRPVCTRWATHYWCVSVLMDFKENLNELLEATITPKFQFTSFSSKELEILEFYLRVMKPFAIAIKSLEGEDGVTYGDLLPRLCTIECQLENLRLSAGEIAFMNIISS